MNEPPIVTLSELVVPSFSKMPIKVSAKTLLNTFCVLPFFISTQVLSQTQHVEADKEAPKVEQAKEGPNKELTKEPTKEASKDGAKQHPTLSATTQSSAHATNRVTNSVTNRATNQTTTHKAHERVTHTSKGPSDEHKQTGTTSASTTQKNGLDVKSKNSNADGASKQSPTPATPGVAVPAPIPSTPAIYGNSGNTGNSANSPNPEAPNSAAPPNNAAPTTSGTTPGSNSAGSIGTNSDQASQSLNKTGSQNFATPTNSSSTDSNNSWIGSFVDSFLSIPLLSPKPAPVSDKSTLISLGPLPEPVPAPLYLNPSKHSSALIAPYSLSSGERNTTGDNAVLDMAQAFKRGDRKRLSSTLSYAAGHPLEPWAAYWELRARLDEANYSEIREFLKRYAGTYQEDRMRNDWLLMAGSRREWDTLLDEYPYFRMRDDKELQCYYLLAQFVQLGPKAQPDTGELVLQNWHALRDADDGCMLAVDRLYDARKISEIDIWRKVRLATEYNQGRLAKSALKIVAPKYLPDLEDIFKNPSRFLGQPINAPSRARDELITAALIRLSASDPADAIRQLLTRWISQLTNEQRTWVWAVAGREAALRGDPKSLEYFEHASADKEIGNDELLAWKVRIALRVDVRPRWEMVEQAILAMSPNAQKDPTWTYWRARAILQKKPQTAQNTLEAQTLLNSVAGVKGFYEQLALEELGKKITTPPRAEPLKAQETSAVKANPSLRRALYAINLGLRSEGNREWNYATNLVDNAGKLGGMSDRELLAAASYACELEVWDRCVNSAERSKVFDANLRFPMPFKDMVFKRTKEISLDPAYVYGLIRQESRFVMDAKSTVGASGLMQVMPKTAAWTAKKIGLLNFKPESLASRDVNIAIGTGYLKLVLDSFEGSMPMAAAAYNAGPSRVRRWQDGSIVEGAIWAESLPFNETRDYVKKVLANTVNYQALITSEPQSLKARLGVIGPMDAAKALLENPDLP